MLATIESHFKVVGSITLLQRSAAVEVERRTVLPRSVALHLPGGVFPGTTDTRAEMAV
jgi:hypothetical protein